MWVCVRTAKGVKRKHNEDSYRVIGGEAKNDYDTVRRGTMFAVADGMGGQRGDGIASKMACEGLSDYYSWKLSAQEPLRPQRRLNLLEKVIYRIHNKIEKYGQENKAYAHMGTTLSVLLLVDNQALIAHVGDSRIYRLRRNHLEKLTENHTMAQLSVEMGYLRLQKGENHPLQHLLTQAVGEGVDEIQTRIEKVKAGDIFLLCTDGLYGILSEDEIKKTLWSDVANHSACDRLVGAALGQGGKDDVTVIVVQV
jgi:serine/threonine protein phosphatase PrpC